MKKIAPIATTAVIIIITAVLLFALRIPVPPLQVGFLYNGEPAEHTAQYFEQPLIYNMEFTRLNAGGNPDLKPYDLIIADSSVTDTGPLREYAENGGSLAFTGKHILQNLHPETSFIPYTPKMGADALPGSQFGQIFADYMHYFERFADYEALRGAPAGYALRPAPHITPLVLTADGSGVLAAKTELGQGEIYYFGALLPDTMFTASFDMRPREGELPYFNNTAAAASHLLWNELASTVSKKARGFSLKRVFGLHGRPSMAHQNHFEVLSAIGQGSLELFAEMAQAHDQIASFSLAEGVYEWFDRRESFGYLLADENGEFHNDPASSFYSTGSHIVCDGRWLNLAQSESRISYFLDPDEPTRSYPAVLDFNNDGIPDLISGSSDGYFHVFEGVTLYPRWTVEYRGLLTGPDGTPLSAGAFSAPAIRDNLFVSGSYGGSLYIWDWDGSLQIKGEPAVVPPPEGETLSAPCLADGITVGFQSGRIYTLDNDVYTLLLDTGEKNAAPRVAPDGTVIYGTHNGDIKGIDINGAPVNFKGTAGFNSGNNVTPVFYDLNGDGRLDLIWGLLEYGRFAVSITDPLFPYRPELRQALETLESMYVPVILHSYTHRYMSIEDERARLISEIKALREYGIETPAGVNQHTWHTSAASPAQTLYLQLEQGFLWNSGFRPSGSPANPADNAEYGLITPFYLYGDGNQILLCNANFMHDGFWAPARYDLPITLFRHTEYDALNNPGALEDYLIMIGEAQESLLYNFVTEPQLFKSIAAAMSAEVGVYRRPIDIFADFLRRLTGRTPRLDLRLETVRRGTTAPLYDERYASSIGVRVELGATARPYMDTSSPVRYTKDGAFFLSLTGGTTRIWTRHQPAVPPVHLLAVNLPAKITERNGEITVEFLEDGLQQVFYYSDGEIRKISKTGARSTFIINSTINQESAPPLP